MMTRLLLWLAFFVIATIGPAGAQSYTGKFPPGTILGNPGSSTVKGTPNPSSKFTGTLLVPSIGMQANNAFDNSSLLATLMAALGPAFAGSLAVTFPAISGAVQTEYYFSSPLSLSRFGQFGCKGGSGPRSQTVTLVFAPGIDGVVFEETSTSADGSWSNALFENCAIASLGLFGSLATSGNLTITQISNQSSAHTITQPSWGAGDGVIAFNQLLGDTAPTVPAGAYIDSATSDTITLHSGFAPTGTGVNGTFLWRLPADKVFHVNTTIGSNVFTVTSGSYKLQSGDLIWSDAFPFGTTVVSVSGPVGAQTVTVWDQFLATAVANATVTHTGGSGLLWKIPAGIKHRTQAKAIGNYVHWFPIGIQASCTSGGGLNCTTMYHEQNSTEKGLVGRWTSGNNTGASTSHANEYINNMINDIFEGGTIGSMYTGDNSNSGSQSAVNPIQGNCHNNNTSTFFGMYIDAGARFQYCTGGGGTSKATFISPMSQFAYDVPTYNDGVFNNVQTFQFPGFNGCFQPVVGINEVGAFSKNCTSFDKFSWFYDSTNDAWDLAQANTGDLMRYTGPAYTGYVPNAQSHVMFPVGLLIQPAGGAVGSERLLDAGTSVPGGSARLRADWRLTTTPSAGGFVGWVNTADGANFRPFGPVAVDTAGTQFAATYWQTTPTVVGSLITCNAGNEGVRAYVTDQNTAVAYRGAVTGGGSTRQAVLCSNNAWIQD